MLLAILTADVGPLSTGSGRGCARSIPLIREHLFDFLERVPQRDQFLALGDAMDGARLFEPYPPGGDRLLDRERLRVEVRVGEAALGQKAGMKALDVLAVQPRRGGRGRTGTGAEFARRRHGLEASTNHAGWSAAKPRTRRSRESPDSQASLLDAPCHDAKVPSLPRPP